MDEGFLTAIIDDGISRNRQNEITKDMRQVKIENNTAVCCTDAITKATHGDMCIDVFKSAAGTAPDLIISIKKDAHNRSNIHDLCKALEYCVASAKSNLFFTIFISKVMVTPPLFKIV